MGIKKAVFLMVFLSIIFILFQNFSFINEANYLDIVAPGGVDSAGNNTISSRAFSIPVGWARSSPMVIVDGQYTYTPLFYPCSLATKETKKKYCLKILRNGVDWSPVLRMGDDFIPTPYTGQEAFEPPSLFKLNGEIVVAYWAQIVGSVAKNDVRSLINVLSLSIPIHFNSTPQWQQRQSHLAPPGHSLNYLGGALGPNGDIYISGWLNANNNTSASLNLLKFSADKSLPPQTHRVITFETFANALFYKPLYSHVAVKPNGEIQIATTLSNMTVCQATGKSQTVFKMVEYYRGFFGSQFSKVWTEASNDALEDPQTNGDSCLTNSTRFAMDMFHDDDTNSSFTIVKARDIAARTLQANQSFNQTLRLWQVVDGRPTLLSTDLTPVFITNNPITDGKIISHVSLSKISSRYVLVAAKENGRAVVVTTLDFKTFDKPIEVKAPFAIGESVKINQPFKNGSDLDTNVLNMWYGGWAQDPINPTAPPSEWQYFNYFLRYRLAWLGIIPPMTTGEKIVQMDSARYHGVTACGVTDQGAVKCWGDNAAGQLGNGKTDTHPTLVPVSVTGLKEKIQKVSTGITHTCALSESGRVWCWGQDTRSLEGKVQLPGVIDLKQPAQDISTPLGASCSVLQDGTAQCWGRNADGVLGIGDDKLIHSPDPLFVLDQNTKRPFTGISRISSTGYQSCLLTQTGEVWCWGSGGNGEHVLFPRKIKLPSKAVQISVSYTFGCAVLVTGEVFCWGCPFMSCEGITARDMADGTPFFHLPWPPIAGLNDSVQQVSVGHKHICVLLRDGKVKCWGDNFFGTLGSGDRVASMTPVTVNLEAPATHITSGEFLSCAAMSNGKVKCWGNLSLSETDTLQIIVPFPKEIGF